MNSLYFILLKLIRCLYSSDIIKYKDIEWREITNTVNKGFYEIDYEPLNIRIINPIITYIQRLLIDNTEKKEINEWLTENQRIFGENISIEKESFESLDDYFWNKTGGFFLEKIGDNYVADFSYLEDYDVKEQFHHYGGKITLKDGKITSIEYLNKTYDIIPIWLQQVVRSTIAIISVIQTHLLRLHLLTAQPKAIEFRKFNDHRLPLLKMLTFGTLEINRNASIVFSIVKNLTAFTDSGWERFIKKSVSLGAIDNMVKNEEIGWGIKLKEYTNDVEKLLSSLDAKELTSFFVAVTAGHNQFGDASIANLTINLSLPPKTRINEERFISKMEIEELGTVARIVSSRPPLLCQTLKENILQCYDENKQKEILKFIEKYIIRTEGWFTPGLFETSIAV